MTKYNLSGQRRVIKKSEGPHPIWRGIGCLMILIVPIMSFALAAIFVQIALQQNWPVPYQLLGNPVMPKGLWDVSVLAPILAFIQAQTNLYAILALTILFIIVLGGVLSVGYAFIYRFIGPPRYSPLDAPPASGKVKSYKR